MDKNSIILGFLLGLIFGFLIASCTYLITSIDYLKISVYQTRQEILQLPNGTTWLKIRTEKDLDRLEK